MLFVFCKGILEVCAIFLYTDMGIGDAIARSSGQIINSDNFRRIVPGYLDYDQFFLCRYEMWYHLHIHTHTQSLWDLSIISVVQVWILNPGSRLAQFCRECDVSVEGARSFSSSRRGFDHRSYRLASRQLSRQSARLLEVVGSIKAPGARSILVGSVSGYCNRLRQKSCSPHSVSVWQHVKLSDVSLGTRPRYSLVAEENVKKPTNQPNK